MKKPSLECRVKILEELAEKMEAERADGIRERESLFRHLRRLAADCRELLTDNKALRLERMGKRLKEANRFIADPLEPKFGGKGT